MTARATSGRWRERRPRHCSGSRCCLLAPASTRPRCWSQGRPARPGPGGGRLGAAGAPRRVVRGAAPAGGRGRAVPGADQGLRCASRRLAASSPTRCFRRRSPSGRAGRAPTPPTSRCAGGAGGASAPPARGQRSARALVATVESDDPGELLVLPRRARPDRGQGRGRQAAEHSRGSRTAPRRAGSMPARSSSRSTGCAPTARAARPRASTGPPWRGPASCSSGA